MASAPATTRSIWIDLLLYPTHTLPTAAAPVLVALGLAARDGVLAPGPAAAALVASWCVHVAGVFMDNYRLLVDHPDVREHPELTDAVRDGSLSLAHLWWATLACLALAGVSGAVLVPRVGLLAPILGAIGIAASLGYSTTRYALTRLGIADAVFFIMFGIVAVAGAYAVQASSPRTLWWTVVVPRVPWQAFVVGLPVGAIVTDVLLIDDMRDAAFDAVKGWSTRPVRFGLRTTQIEFVALMVFAYLMPVWIAWPMGFGSRALLPLLTLPFAVRITRVVWMHTRREALFAMTPQTAWLALAYGALLALGIATSAFS